MSEQQIVDGAFINSLVGEGTQFRGDIRLNGLLRIDGDYSGVIRTADKVLVGKNGRAECTIHAGTVVIGGVMKGNIFAGEKVIVLSTGMVIGNIQTPRLVVEEGVVLNGACQITGGPHRRTRGTGSEGVVQKGFSPSRGAQRQEADTAQAHATFSVVRGGDKDRRKASGSNGD
jgi:cytoskeletal protein CcmA (bactofilin family)